MAKNYLLNSEKKIKDLLPYISRTLQNTGIDNIVKAKTILGVGWEIVFHQSQNDLGCRFLINIFGKDKKETNAVDVLFRALIQAMVNQGDVWGPGFYPMVDRETVPLPEFWKSWEHMENETEKATKEEKDLVYFWMTTKKSVKQLQQVLNLPDIYRRLTELRQKYPDAKISNDKDSELPSRNDSVVAWNKYLFYRSDEEKEHNNKLDEFDKTLNLIQMHELAVERILQQPKAK